MSKPIDLTNQKFNYWTVIERAENNKRGEAMWLCECECGTRKIVNGYSLRSGTSKSCGCLQKKIAAANNFKDLKNQKFGHLTVLEYAGKDNSNKSLWKCECDCEAKTIIITRGSDLLSGKTQSCGCIRSRGEAKIAQLLEEHGFVFEKEKTFDTCRFPDTNGLARFDFWVNNKYLIEFDGIQHYKPTFNQLLQDVFLITQSHDEYKDNWCKENNIPLIRINYKQLNNLTIKDLVI